MNHRLKYRQARVGEDKMEGSGGERTTEANTDKLFPQNNKVSLGSCPR